MEKRNDIEILAPAGNYESLVSAVVNGANAVYLGAFAFSARSKAGNFTLEELEKAVNYCHLFGVKVYLAVNTIIKPSEYNNALELIKTAKNIGVDAFIVQDIVFLTHLHSTMRDIIVHLSTQAGIHNLEGALVAQNLGVSRVVLSRETLIEDVIKIKKNTNLEIEYFVHGALCVSFSGNCYLSSLATGLSGNRGKCLQFCRKEYSCSGKKGYLLSPKDICLDDKINELISAGVTSFKIEGRMKRPEYVGETVKYYRDLLGNRKASKSNISKIYNRGDFCSAYLNNPTENLIYPHLQGHKGEYIGKVVSVDGKIATVSVSQELKGGDAVKFIRGEREVGTALIGKNCESKKDKFGQFIQKITYLGSVKSGDSVNITTDVLLMDEISRRTRKIPVRVDVVVENGTIFARGKLESGDVVTLEGAEILSKAINSPVSCEDFRGIFSKLGDTHFELADFLCEIDGNYFAQKAKLNEFRRSFYTKIEQTILNQYKIEQNIEISTKSLGALGCGFDKIERFIGEQNCILAQTDNPEIALLLKDSVDFVAYFPKNYSSESTIKTMKALGKQGFLVLPNVARGLDLDVLSKIVNSSDVNGVIVNNLYGLTLAKEKNVILGHGLNVINPQFGGEKILSVEYDGMNFGDNFVYVYGNFPVMTFSHCPKITINNGKCLNCNQENIEILDEKRNKFNIHFYKIARCYSQMQNTVPINGLNLIKNGKIKKAFLDFTGHDWESVCKILKVVKGELPFAGESTSGYFSKKLS